LTWDTARRQRRTMAHPQPRNERGQIELGRGNLAPGDGTLPRDVRAHLAGVKPRPKRHRHRDWPRADQPRS
jgi:hypothetical protein